MIKDNQSLCSNRISTTQYSKYNFRTHAVKKMFDSTKSRYGYHLVAFLTILFLPCIVLAAEEQRIYWLEKQRTSAFTYATDINSHGQITGYGNQGFLWEDGKQEIVTPNSYWSETTAINDLGQIVGMAAPSPNSTLEPGQAFFWDKENGLTFIDVPGNPWSIARDINNNGVVVGLSTKAVSEPYLPPIEAKSDAFVWAEGTGITFIIGFGGANTVALGTNDSESPKVVGASQTADGLYTAYAWTKENGIQRLDTTEDTQSFATSVNNSGTTVGWVGEPPRYNWSWLHNFVRDDDAQPLSRGAWEFSTMEILGLAAKWQNGSRIELGTLPGFNHSVALDINNKDFAVGYASLNDSLERKAILIGPDNVMQDLNDIFHPNQHVLEVASAINDDGVIIAWGRPFIGENPQDFRPYILVPSGAGKYSELSVELILKNIGIDDAKAKIGDQLTYQTQVWNYGPDNSNALLTYHFTFGADAINYPNSCSYSQKILTCPLGLLNSNLGKAIEITLQVNALGRQHVEVFLTGDHIQLNQDIANISAELYVENISIPTPRYLLTDLGPAASGEDLNQPGSHHFSQAYGLNENGTVVGRLGNSGFIYRNEQWTIMNDNCSSGIVTCIQGSQWQELSSVNNSEVIVGISGSQSAGTGLLLNENNNLSVIGSSRSYARAINNLGNIAGFSNAGETNKYSRAFFISDGDPIQYLSGFDGSQSYALAINNNNRVVGSAEDSNKVMRAFIWDSANGTQHLDLPVNTHSFATALSDDGDIAGWYGDKPERVNWSLMFGFNPNAGPSAWYYKDTNAVGNAFVLYQDQFTDLGPGLAYDINNKGLAVGYWRSPSVELLDDTLPFPRTTFNHGAFLYDSNFNQFLYLDDNITTEATWSLRVASALNDKGQIVGWGEVNNEIHAFLLTPDPAQEKADLSILFESLNNIGAGRVKFHITNHGPDASDVNFRQEIPENTIVSNLPAECTKEPQAVTCFSAALNNGESRTLEYGLSNTNNESFNSDAIVFGSVWDQDSTNNKVSALITAPPSQCNGDFDSDGDVDGKDLAVFSAQFGKVNCPQCEADFDEDGDVDGSDLSEFSGNFGGTDCLSL